MASSRGGQFSSTYIFELRPLGFAQLDVWASKGVAMILAVGRTVAYNIITEVFIIIF